MSLQTCRIYWLILTLDITKTDFDAHVEVSSLDVDKIFWKKLERNIEKVEDFYQSQIEFLIEKFHILVLKVCINTQLY